MSFANPTRTASPPPHRFACFAQGPRKSFAYYQTTPTGSPNLTKRATTAPPHPSRKAQPLPAPSKSYPTIWPTEVTKHPDHPIHTHVPHARQHPLTTPRYLIPPPQQSAYSGVSHAPYGTSSSSAAAVAAAVARRSEEDLLRARLLERQRVEAEIEVEVQLQRLRWEEAARRGPVFLYYAARQGI
ncbi:hypothetical protein BDK51DRAFT_51766 [Blyttiomyces helicus]|uniref:Uncharacterized protein n=1 Tax=Blyttiomyces helicus TaxID=388810 RepID=A0A4P9W208_9FUNG|nr:hypothetical protein BDK51DRAFT_51766 [Blyttiomyces helicus]|eukprot:RKO85742.1 hypothetical protein BDK51DRAFT_51766 [Blyttiomyces helicus]